METSNTEYPKTTSLLLKLLVDAKTQRVVFAEADKDFVDFLSNLLCLPIGTVTKLLSSKSMVGSLGNLYQSIENLSDTYLQPNLDKDTLLNPKAPIGSYPKTLFMLPDAPSESKLGQKIYTCANVNGYGCGHTYFSNELGAVCPQCGNRMSVELSYVAVKKGEEQGSSSCGGEGYVKGVVTYMVMDDLQVKPLSLISTLALLTKLTTALEERLVYVGIDEGLKLLKASLVSKTVLTDVFLMKTSIEEETS